MFDFYNAYKEKILQFILYRFQRSIGIRACIPFKQALKTLVLLTSKEIQS